MTATADPWEYPTQRKFDNVAPLSEVDPNDTAGKDTDQLRTISHSNVQPTLTPVIQDPIQLRTTAFLAIHCHPGSA